MRLKQNTVILGSLGSYERAKHPPTEAKTFTQGLRAEKDTRRASRIQTPSAPADTQCPWRH